MSLESSGPAQTRAWAAMVARGCKRGDCLLLTGDLGAGKTEFARGFIGALCNNPDVTSPTFTLVHPYALADGGMLYHFDLYRLKSAHELIEIGFDEALDDGISLIEWPDIARAQLPEYSLDVTITHGDAPDARRLCFSGDAGRWGEAFDNVRKGQNA